MPVTPAACPACGAAEAVTVATLEGIPVLCNELWPSEEEATRAPRADLRLSACLACGLLWNTAFDGHAVDYSARYENSLHFSPTFQRYATALTDHLADAFDLAGGYVVEIGCGQGDFLALLAARGARVTGYDPSFSGEPAAGVTVIPEHYGPGCPVADAVVVRHVLEHVASPAGLLSAIRGAAENGVTRLSVEVPDAGYMVRTHAYWDLIYEHAAYFAAPALRAILARTGFEVTDLGTAFSGQFLWAEAVAAAPRDPAPPRPGAGPAVAFGAAQAATVDSWERRLAGADRPVALWGAGSKGVTFLNVVPGAGAIEKVVDVNPRKHGRYVAGTGHRVEPPDALRKVGPGTVLVMNPVYRAEIEASLREMGAGATVAAV